MGFRYTGIRVQDLDRSVTFYTTVLGMRVTWRMKIRETRGEISGSTALKAEPEQKLSPAEQLKQQPLALPRADARGVADTRVSARAIAAEKRAEAKAKGYEGEACGECGNFTLVRNGTCLKCDTCGGTSGCS